MPGVFEFKPYASTKDWREHPFVAFERGYVRVDLPAPLAINRAGTAEVFRDLGGETAPTTTHPVLPSISAMASQARNFCSPAKRRRCAPPPRRATRSSCRDWAMSPAFA